MRSLIALSEFCTGCQRCVIACSYTHTKTFTPSKSRIWITRMRRKVDYITICNQCGICINSCPFNALKRDLKTGAVIVDEMKCTGCGFCVNACPWGAIIIDVDKRKALKCDLCGGDPICVKVCPENALRFLGPTEIAKLKRINTIRLIGE